jgi:hypothetical protein
MAFFDPGSDEIRVDYWENGSWTDYASTAVTWPLEEWLTVELDYRDSDSSTITMTVFDASGAELASTSLAHTAYDGGAVGWYNYFAAADLYADSWLNDWPIPGRTSYPLLFGRDNAPKPAFEAVIKQAREHQQ